MLRIGLLLVAFFVAATAAPAAAQTTDESWCAGLFDYLDEQTRLSFSDEAAGIARRGCIEYIETAGPPPTPARPGDGSQDAAFLRFADRALAAMAEVRRAAASGLGGGGSFEDEARSFEALAEWAASERRWLQDNPPQACWADLQRRWAEGIGDIEAGARTMAEGIRERDLEKVSLASDRLLGTVDRLNELGDLLGELDC